MEGKINVKFTGTGLKAVITGLDRCRDAQDEAARTLEWRIHNLITTGSRSGRMYGKHQASAPGEPPARLSGKLSKSIEFRRVNQYASSVRVTKEYAIFLEYGTGKIQPRPFMTVAAKLAQQAMKRRISGILRSSNVPFVVIDNVSDNIASMEE